MSVLASASSVAVTPSGMVARCFPCPKGSLYSTGTPNGSRCTSSTSSRERVRCQLGVVLPVALRHLSNYDSAKTGQFAALGELGQDRIGPVRLQADVLEEEDRALEVELPRRAHGRDEERKAASDERSGRLPAADRADVWVVGVVTAPCRRRCRGARRGAAPSRTTWSPRRPCRGARCRRRWRGPCAAGWPRGAR